MEAVDISRGMRSTHMTSPMTAVAKKSGSDITTPPHTGERHTCVSRRLRQQSRRPQISAVPNWETNTLCTFPSRTYLSTCG